MWSLSLPRVALIQAALLVAYEVRDSVRQTDRRVRSESCDRPDGRHFRPGATLNEQVGMNLKGSSDATPAAASSLAIAS